MRGRPALALLLLLTAHSAIAGQRELLLRKLLRRAPHLRPTAAPTPARRRATLPPLPSPCADAILARADVSALTVSGDTIFFTDYEMGLMSVPKTGGTPVSIVSNPSLTFGPVVADATTLYYITADNDTTGSIYGVPKSGGSPKLLATSLPAPIDIRIDATTIYWLNLGTVSGNDVAADGSLERMAKDGSGRQKLIGDLSAPAALDTDGHFVFFGETGFATGAATMGLRRVSNVGGAVTSLLDGVAVFAIAVTSADVFYSGVDTNTLDNVVARIPKSGGTPPQVLDSGVIALAMLVRDSRVYFVATDQDSNTTINSVTPSGDFLRVIKTVDLDSPSIAVDDCAVYFASNFALQRTPR